MRTLAPLLLASLAGCTTATATIAPDPYVGPAERATIEALERIETIDPKVNSVLAVDPTALEQARRVDRLRIAPGPLTGVPVLLKDNIEAAGPLPTTAGSLALADNVTDRDSPLVTGLRSAGAVILGKTNLSEWANFRSEESISGWSAVGDQTRNPYALDRSPCGSSSGSGAAVAAGIVDIAIGTETWGSITCPASMNGVVGLKPTVGMVSRTHIVPISITQDTAGPITRTVFQAAAVMDAIAISDPADPATEPADRYRGTFLAALEGASLDGVRLGVLEFATGFGTDEAFEEAKAQLVAQGAILVPIAELGGEALDGAREYNILLTEFRDGLNTYLATTPDTVKTRTLADVIAFNEANERELSVFDQSIFLKAEETRIDDPAYVEGVEANVAWAANAIDRLLADNQVEALIFPTYAPAMKIKSDGEDDSDFGGGAGYLAAFSGYPQLTVPMGMTKGLPVGLSFVGAKWGDARLLALGHAYEQARPPIPAPTFAATLDKAN